MSSRPPGGPKPPEPAERLPLVREAPCAETRRLAPFPDELLEPERKQQAIEFLLALGLPYYIASAHLGRWAAYVDVELDRADYWKVGRRRFRPLE